MKNKIQISKITFYEYEELRELIETSYKDVLNLQKWITEELHDLYMPQFCNGAIETMARINNVLSLGVDFKYIKWQIENGKNYGKKK